MIIPTLSQSWENGKRVLNKEFVHFNDAVNWSPERSIEILWNTAYKILYQQDVQSWKITQEYAEKKLQALNHTYASVKHKFQNINRNNGGRYFDHLLRVAYNVLIESKKPSLRKLLIALHHDSIEDTDYDLHTLETTLNIKIALWVAIISKRPFTELTTQDQKNWDKILPEVYILDELKEVWFLRKDDDRYPTHEYLEKKYNKRHLLKKSEIECERKWVQSLSDWEKLKYIQSSGILNRKWLLNDRFINKKNFNPEQITVEEKFFEEWYEELNLKYRNMRNYEYFSHMLPATHFIYYIDHFRDTPCMNNFYNHTRDVIEQNKIIIEVSTIKSIVLDALEVKFWDRIDNLQTTEVYSHFTTENIKKAYRKIEETKKFFYRISKEFDVLQGTDFFHRISMEIEKLEQKIFEYQSVCIWSEIQSKIWKLSQ